MDANFRYTGASAGTGVQPTILVNPETHAMLVEGATGGGGSGGDASAANQAAGNALLTTIASNTTPGAGGLTDGQLRATAVPVSLASVPSHAVTGPLTDVELRATAVPVSGPATDAQLRATPIPVSGAVTTGGLTDGELRATAVPVSGPLTDAQLRATAVPVYSTITSPAQAPYGLFAKVNPFGALAVETSAAPLFNDAFQAPLNTASQWTASGTVTPTVTGGALIQSLGAVNSASSVLTSQPSFLPSVQPFMLAVQLNIGAQQTNPNSHRFFGIGSVTGYTTGNPLTDGFGFEVDLTGALNIVVYVSGVRYVVNSTNPALITGSGAWATNMTLSNFGANLVYPSSGMATIVMRFFLGTAYFYMLGGPGTSFDVPVGVANWIPVTGLLPIRLAAITTVAVSTVLATTFTANGLVMAASGGTQQTISDPVYAWRQAGVNTSVPLASDGALTVRQAPSDIFRTSFAEAYANSVGSDWSLLQTGTGMTVNQTGGNLVITSNTTANAETVIRSTRSFRGALSFRYKSILSQRIVQNNFIIELADVLGDLLAYTINSATSVTVTFIINPFTSANVGQFVNLGVITGAAGIPGRYAVASVSGLTVTFTVAAWPGSGTGTLSVYGWNYLRANYNNTTATNVGFDTQRRGWNTGDSALTINTTASPGHIGAIQTDGLFADYSDSLVATAAAPAFTARGSRLENIPNDDVALFIFIRVLNGTSAPATTTTWTVGMVLVDLMGNQKVFLAGAANTAANRALPTTVSSGTVTTVSTVTLLSGTTALTPGVAAANLGKAEDAVAASADTGVFALGVRRDAPVISASASGDYNEIAVNKWGAILTSPFAGTGKTFRGVANVTAAASATDIAILPGNATNTVYVTKVTISGLQTTAGLVDVLLIKRSTADTGGTSAAITSVPLDASDAAAVSLPLSFTANPTLGNTIGSIDRVYVAVAPLATGTQPVDYTFEFGRYGKPVILSGVAQELAVNLNGVTVTGGVFNVVFEWVELV